jgi:DNA-binding response OmpR family regulator
MERVRILVVEDNPDLASAIRHGLNEHGYSVDVAHEGYRGEELAATEPYDLVILDLMLPDRDGVDLCKNLRRRGIETSVLMLTALSGTADKVSGLDAGADDYLTKPFEFEELLARVRALLRRGTAQEATRLEGGGVELDLLRRQAQREGRKIKLSAKEFALLEFLMRNQDRVIDRITIAQKVWDINYEPSSNVIDVYISALRKKVDRDFDHPLIHTVVGMGYRFGKGDEVSGSDVPASAS